MSESLIQTPPEALPTALLAARPLREFLSPRLGFMIFETARYNRGYQYNDSLPNCWSESWDGGYRVGGVLPNGETIIRGADKGVRWRVVLGPLVGAADKLPGLPALIWLDIYNMPIKDLQERYYSFVLTAGASGFKYANRELSLLLKSGKYVLMNDYLHCTGNAADDRHVISLRLCNAAPDNI